MKSFVIFRNRVAIFASVLRDFSVWMDWSAHSPCGCRSSGLFYYVLELVIYLFNAPSTSSRLLKLRSMTNEYDGITKLDIFILI